MQCASLATLLAAVSLSVSVSGGAAPLTHGTLPPHHFFVETEHVSSPYKARAPSAATGLLTDFQKSPATGIRAEPRFGWIVPGCDAAGAGSDHVQTSYRVSMYAASSLLVRCTCARLLCLRPRARILNIYPLRALLPFPKD